MQSWLGGTVLKANGRRNHRRTPIVRNQTLIQQQKLNRMGNVEKKMALMATRISRT